MTDTPQVGGAIITYLTTSDTGLDERRRALLTGIGVADPESGVTWVGIITADHGLTLIDPELIVDCGHGRPGGPPVVVDVLAGALAVLACELIELDEHSDAAPEPLTRFLTVLAPIEGQLAALGEQDPYGPVQTALRCIGCAAERFARGQFADAKAGILLADAIMSGMAGAGP